MGLNERSRGDKIIQTVRRVLLRARRSEVCGTHRRDRSVVTEVAIPVIQPQAKECQPPPEAGRDKGQILSTVPGGNATLAFRLLASSTVTEYISLVLGHQVCGNLLPRSQETKSPSNSHPPLAVQLSLRPLGFPR